MRLWWLGTFWNIDNDDSRIFAMLLAANPQLQQVSKTRAEKIMRIIIMNGFLSIVSLCTANINNYLQILILIIFQTKCNII